jgi:hypothetical protein
MVSDCADVYADAGGAGSFGMNIERDRTKKVRKVHLIDADAEAWRRVARCSGCLHRYGKPVRKLATMNEVGPYRPLARSFTNMLLSSRYAGMYATCQNVTF